MTMPSMFRQNDLNPAVGHFGGDIQSGDVRLIGHK